MFGKTRQLDAVVCLRSASDRLLPIRAEGNTLGLPQDRWPAGGLW